MESIPLVLAAVMALVASIRAQEEAPASSGVPAVAGFTDDEVYAGGPIEEATASEKQGLDPVHVESYEARVDVTAFKKRGKALADYKNRMVLVKFKCVTDPRYKGEVIPKMEKGHTYLIYGRTVRLDADGMAVIFVNSSRELYKIEQTQQGR
jgi:hypothetical protein